MLKGIPDRIGSNLLKALADMGHGDLLVIADDFYPPITKTPNGISIQAKGNSAIQMLDSILQLFPLDVDYCPSPVEYMIPDKNSNINIPRPEIWDHVIETVKSHGFSPDIVGEIERTKFYEKAKNAYVTVCTSERQPYGCIIVQKGVL